MINVDLHNSDYNYRGVPESNPNRYYWIVHIDNNVCDLDVELKFFYEAEIIEISLFDLLNFT